MEQQKNPTGKNLKVLTVPNLLSFLRICLIPLIIWFYCVKKQYVGAGITLILSGLTDIVDGYIARRFHMISDLGKVLDPIADKLTQAAMLVCLITRFPLMLIPFVLLIAKETYMTVSGMIVIQKTGIVMGAEWHGKVATALLYATMVLHVFWFDLPSAVSFTSILLCALSIALSFFLYGVRNTRAINRANRKNRQTKG